MPHEAGQNPAYNHGQPRQLKTVFSSLAAHHQSGSAAARLLKPNHRLAISHFMLIFNEAFHKSVTPANILAGFKPTGTCIFRAVTRGAAGAARAAPLFFGQFFFLFFFLILSK